MELFLTFIDFFIHLDRHLGTLINYFGKWTYAIVFVVIFCETGLVVTPFLPGDSLLFGLGTFAALGFLCLDWLIILISVAAIMGNVVNYAIGSYLGPKIFRGENVRFLNKAYLDKTQRFYEKHGGKTIVLARFIPIVRTFAPFVAGIGKMSYPRFLFYNVVGCIAWVITFVLGGYYFGNLKVIKNNFSLVIFAIIVISVMPVVIEYFRQLYRST